MTIDVGGGLLNALLFMGPLGIIGMLIAMFLWERTCRLKIKVVLVKSAGGTAVYYADKEGSEVTISNPSTGWSGTWPISELATIPQPYPDLAGLLPRFLQREIQMALFIEGDVEPLLSRTRHRDNVLSPNVYNLLSDIVDDVATTGTVKRQLQVILDNAVTGPSRELIASPDWIGALRKSTALKALASVSDDLMEALKQIRNQLARFSGLNSTYVYIGLGLIIVLLAFNLYFTIQGGQVDVSTMKAKVDAIYDSLGIK